MPGKPGPDWRRMWTSPRCGARTRKGSACQAPAVSGRRRCRMHGGTEGAGAPMGNQNALKHGRCARAAIDERHEIRRLIEMARQHLLETR